MSLDIIFATGNPNKIEEVTQILPPGLNVRGLQDINCPADLPETQDTLQGNAMQKARYVKDNYGVNCFADDTGLEIDALKGAPGVMSARYAGAEKDSNANIRKVLQQLEGKKNRRAKFRTVIAALIEEEELTFEGIVKGTIINEPRGKDGFGYDPVFVPEGYDLSFAEMPLQEKNAISHRYKAIKMFSDYLMSLNYI